MKGDSPRPTAAMSPASRAQRRNACIGVRRPYSLGSTNGPSSSTTTRARRARAGWRPPRRPAPEPTTTRRRGAGAARPAPGPGATVMGLLPRDAATASSRRRDSPWRGARRVLEEEHREERLVSHEEEDQHDDARALEAFEQAPAHVDGQALEGLRSRHEDQRKPPDDVERREEHEPSVPLTAARCSANRAARVSSCSGRGPPDGGTAPRRARERPERGAARGGSAWARSVRDRRRDVGPARPSARLIRTSRTPGAATGRAPAQASSGARRSGCLRRRRA